MGEATPLGGPLLFPLVGATVAVAGAALGTALRPPGVVSGTSGDSVFFFLADGPVSIGTSSSNSSTKMEEKNESSRNTESTKIMLLINMVQWHFALLIFHKTFITAFDWQITEIIVSRHEH